MRAGIYKELYEINIFLTHIYKKAWMGQELLTTFESEIGELALIPGDSAVFKVTAGDGI